MIFVQRENGITVLLGDNESRYKEGFRDPELGTVLGAPRCHVSDPGTVSSGYQQDDHG